MLRPIILIASLVIVACASTGGAPRPDLPKPLILEVKVVPELGDPAPPGFESGRQGVLAGPSQTYHSFTARQGNREFEVGISSDGLVSFISTNDRDFVSPEGVRVGTRFPSLLTDGVEVAREPGWGCHVALRSGWHAATGIGGPDCGRKVMWLFKRS